MHALSMRERGFVLPRLRIPRPNLAISTATCQRCTIGRKGEVSEESSEESTGLREGSFLCAGFCIPQFYHFPICTGERRAIR